MKTPISMAVLAATLIALPAAAQTAGQGAGQNASPRPGAAATLPNSFGDQAAAQRPALSPGRTPIQPGERPAATQTQARTETPGALAPDIARTQQARRAVIASLQAGDVDYSMFTTDLAAKIREKSGDIVGLVQQFGAVKTMTHRGQQDGADMFRVDFEKQSTDWVIGFDDDNQIAALLFRPAQP